MNFKTWKADNESEFDAVPRKKIKKTATLPNQIYSEDYIISKPSEHSIYSSLRLIGSLNVAEHYTDLLQNFIINDQLKIEKTTKKQQAYILIPAINKKGFINFHRILVYNLSTLSEIMVPAFQVIRFRACSYGLKSCPNFSNFVLITENRLVLTVFKRYEGLFISVGSLRIPGICTGAPAGSVTANYKPKSPDLITPIHGGLFAVLVKGKELILFSPKSLKIVKTISLPKNEEFKNIQLVEWLDSIQAIFLITNQAQILFVDPKGGSKSAVGKFSLGGESQIGSLICIKQIGKLVCSTSSGKLLICYHLSAYPTDVFRCERHNDPIVSFAYDAKHNYLLALSSKRLIEIRDMKNQGEVKHVIRVLSPDFKGIYLQFHQSSVLVLARPHSGSGMAKVFIYGVRKSFNERIGTDEFYDSQSYSTVNHSVSLSGNEVIPSRRSNLTQYLEDLIYPQSSSQNE